MTRRASFVVLAALGVAVAVVYLSRGGFEPPDGRTIPPSEVTTMLVPSQAAGGDDVSPPETPSTSAPSPSRQLKPDPNDTFPPELPPHPHRVANISATRAFFQTVLVIIMMSPNRYPLVGRVKAHYDPYFPNLYFCGPLSNDSFEVPITGYDIVYGNEQYRAVAKIIRMFAPKYEGYLYLHDDIMIQPWALAADGRKSKAVPWALQMGIGNVRSSKPVNAVPGMSVEPKFRLMWPYWRKNRGKLAAALREGGLPMQEKLRRAALVTPSFIYSKSKYSSRYYNEADLLWAVFYTIVDVYYIPGSLALAYADMCDLMAKHWVFGECAIATMIRALSPVYQELNVHFYWAHKDCPRYLWHEGIDGFHRCRHDHRFADFLYNEAERTSSRQNETFRKEALSWRPPA